MLQSRGRKESDTAERLNKTELKINDNNNNKHTVNNKSFSSVQLLSRV